MTSAQAAASCWDRQTTEERPCAESDSFASGHWHGRTDNLCVVPAETGIYKMRECENGSNKLALTYF